MRITNLDPKKYKRFFAFGCSFTNYFWPTWADIIGQDVEFYENWGDPGGGNHFIFNSFIEADARYNFNSDDLVIIMWSKIEREDRYFNDRWLHATNHNIEEKYGKFWVEKFYLDTRSQLIQSLAYMKSVQTILESKNINWATLFWNDWFYEGVDHFYDLQTEEKKNELFAIWKEKIKELFSGAPLSDSGKNQDVVELYRDVFTNVSGVYRQFADENIKNRVAPNKDIHPMPEEALMFLDWVWPNNTISDESREYVKYWNKKIFCPTENTKPLTIITRL